MTQEPFNPGDEAAPGTPSTGEALCPACGGSGRVSERPCENCGGTGKVVQSVGGE
jgi:DnaJ-class molecular chaperone